MSRTYRKRLSSDSKWLLRDFVLESSISDFSKYDKVQLTWSDRWIYVWYKEDSLEAKKIKAKHFSDSLGWKYNRSGPTYFKTLVAQKPYRRRAKKEIYKFMRDSEEYEVLLESKPKLPYWD